MIATKDFVFIHAPKTGGTFITKNIEKLYDDIKEIADKHAYAQDIPKEYKDYPRLLTLREPLKWYESHYLYGWWRRRPETFPGFKNADIENLSFYEFIKLWNKNWADEVKDFENKNLRFGKLSYVTILYIFDNPKPILEEILKNGTDDFWKRYNLPQNLTILKTSNLNEGLFEFLSKFFNPKEIEFIKNQKRIRPEDDPRGEEEIKVEADKKILEYINFKEPILNELLGNLR